MKITKTKVTKTGWHLLLVSAATAEFAMSRTILRKLLCGACAGWHVAAAIVDWNDEEKDG